MERVFFILESNARRFFLRQGRSRLGELERHLCGAVQLDGGRKFGPCPLTPSHLTIQRAKAEMAVGL
jgi:hypothetical protein